MELDLGPIEGDAVRAFVLFGRTQIDQVRQTDGHLAATFSPGIVSTIDELFDRWDELADDDVFRWAGDLDIDLAHYLLDALYLMVWRRREEVGGVPDGPDVQARRPFVIHLISRFTAALELEPDADHDRLRYLKSHWPTELLG